MDQMVKNAREMADDDLFEHASMASSGSVLNQIYLNEVRRRDLERQKELFKIQEELLFAQRQAVSEASTASMYASESMLAAQKSAQAAENTANYTKDSARWMKWSVIILALASIANVVVSFFHR